MSFPPHAQVHHLQLAVLHEINQLNQPHQGVLEMEVDVGLPSILFPHCFFQQDICTVIHNHRASKALIYFVPKYTFDLKVRAKLYGDLHKAALIGEGVHNLVGVKVQVKTGDVYLMSVFC
jgi:hypothetical protein